MTLILLTTALLLLVAGILIYNRLVRNRNLVDEAWAGIDVQLQKRFELVPNLVESFPSNFMAGTFKFSPAEFFEIELVSQRSAPDVDL